MRPRGCGRRSLPLNTTSPGDGWLIKDPSPRYSGLWKGILSAKNAFMKHVRF